MHENVFGIITHQGKVNYMRCLLSANLMGVFRRSDSLHFKVNGIIVAIVWKADLKGIKHDNREIVFSKLSHIQEEWRIGGLAALTVLGSARVLDTQKYQDTVCWWAVCVQESGVEQHWALSWRNVKTELI